MRYPDMAHPHQELHANDYASHLTVRSRLTSEKLGEMVPELPRSLNPTSRSMSEVGPETGPSQEESGGSGLARGVPSLC